MARGNQRDKAREKNLKEQAGKKSKNTQSGTEFARTKENVAAIMRAKQAAGKSSLCLPRICCVVAMCGCRRGVVEYLC
ncbi:hypothetical protein COCVIDRAFT_105722 [Bipolaris victoriae FI3]|uniref:Small EDRK-rich factor-like N-terminal domain-containing protein n=2 Tax=Bipolaris TaxID=33194 RepID=W7EK04_BIPV3|nr:hypothetical protein COCVIDRAFT_105722 [Bipolaris victoriae FI3]